MLSYFAVWHDADVSMMMGENEMVIVRTDRSMVRAMCRVQLNGR